MNTNSVCMWETLPKNAGWDCFQTQILKGSLRIQDLLRVEHCAFLEVIHFSDKFDVQETNLSFAQFNRIRNHFFGCRIDVGWYPRT